MLLSKNTFNNGTEVDLTNRFHAQPCRTLYREMPRPGFENGLYAIRDYTTEVVYVQFRSLSEAAAYCNLNFETNFTTH